MGYSKRLKIIFSHLKKAETFADVGCDHGYATEYMLQNGLCKRAVFSDVSKGSLQKAEILLKEYVELGVATPVLGDGFYGVPKTTEEVLIAGMGGSEIIGILSHPVYGFMPEKFVFQPMKDGEKLRRYLLDHGGFIERDYTFEDGKYYEMICGRKRFDEPRQLYSDLEIEFGKENLSFKPQAFVKRMQKLLADLDGYLQLEVSKESKKELLSRREKIKEALSYGT